MLIVRVITPIKEIRLTTITLIIIYSIVLGIVV